MGIYRGPGVINDGLVFGYDTGYGIADNDTATRFYPGETTTNLADTDAKRNFAAHGGNSCTTSSAPEYGSGWKKLTVTNIAGNNYRVAQFPYITQPSGSTRTYSVEYDVTGLTGYKLKVDGSGGYSIVSIQGKGRHSFSITPGSTGSYALFLVKSGTHTSINEVVYYRYYQVEVNSHATPFVDGARSATSSLIDLKRTTSINASYVGFDSTGQPEFDGSDDYIDLGSDLAISPINQGWTAEYVFNTDSASTLQHFNGCEEDVHNAGWLALYQSRLQVWDRTSNVWKMGDTVFASNTWYHIAFVQVNGTTMQFYVNGVAEGGNHVGFAWTAAKSAFFARYVGKYEYGGYSRYFNGHIPVTRLYSKALTASEIKQNYNSLKNRFNI